MERISIINFGMASKKDYEHVLFCLKYKRGGWNWLKWYQITYYIYILQDELSTTTSGLENNRLHQQ